MAGAARRRPCRRRGRLRRPLGLRPPRRSERQRDVDARGVHTPRRAGGVDGARRPRLARPQRRPPATGDHRRAERPPCRRSPADRCSSASVPAPRRTARGPPRCAPSASAWSRASPGATPVVEAVIETCRSLWSSERDAAWRRSRGPFRRREIHVGASGVALARLAGRLADGVNVPWAHPRRDELFAAAAAVDRRVGAARSDDVRRLRPVVARPWTRRNAGAWRRSASSA